MFESYRFLQLWGWKLEIKCKNINKTLRSISDRTPGCTSLKPVNLGLKICKQAAKMCRPNSQGFYSCEVWFLFSRGSQLFIYNFTFDFYFPSTVTWFLVTSGRDALSVESIVEPCNLQTLLKLSKLEGFSNVARHDLTSPKFFRTSVDDLALSKENINQK